MTEDRPIPPELLALHPRREWTDADLFRLTRNTSWLSEPVAGDWFDTRPHLLTLYTIARHVNWPDPREPGPFCPPVGLEIGIRHGMTSIAMLHAMRETNGHLISLEVDPEWFDKSRALIASVGDLERWWHPALINSNDFVGTLEPNHVFDFVYIDGDHGESQSRLDVENYAPRVRLGGFLLMHDYWSLPGCQDPAVQEPMSYVSLAVEQILRPSGEWEVLLLPWCFGLVVARRVRSAP